MGSSHHLSPALLLFRLPPGGQSSSPSYGVALALWVPRYLL